MEQTTQECQICLETMQITNFVAICQDVRHMACTECFQQFEDKTICCYCRGINPHYQYEETIYSYSDQSIDNTSYEISDLASEAEFNQYNLFRISPQDDMLQFNILVTNTQAILDAIFILQQLLGNRVQTRAMTRRLNQFQ